MVSNPGFSPTPDEPLVDLGPARNESHKASALLGICAAINLRTHGGRRPLSKWSASFSKRLFDIACVLLSLPVTLPVSLLTGLAVRITSRGPVLFQQQRMGRNGQTFTIYKFRTMPVRRASSARPLVTTAINQRFTPMGPFLRRWKLDELPQLFNVLRGDMSLVGPRPKVRSHQSTRLNCCPGITGRATVVFACEEVTLANIPLAQLDSYYHGVVLPLKQILDDDYMAKATLGSDLKLLVQSIFRNWDDLKLSDILPSVPMSANARNSVVRIDVPHLATVLLPSQEAMVSHPD